MSGRLYKKVSMASKKKRGGYQAQFRAVFSAIAIPR
jgi:hypothetical protein